MRRRRLSADVDFWPAFTDVLSGMLLAMVFVLTLFAVSQAGLVHVVGGQDVALRSLEGQIAELRRLLRSTEARAEELRDELLATTALVETLSAERDASSQRVADFEGELALGAARIADLTRQLREYLREIRELNETLAVAEQSVSQRDSSIADLQLALNRLRAQLANMSSRLADSEKQAQGHAIELSGLIAEMARKDESIQSLRRRIAELELLEKYTSEFLARMSEVFEDNSEIKVVGDRFVFQSEVLFESGSADIGEQGKPELDKFATAFKELMPKLPRDLRVNVQVQGHTDTDRVVLSDRYRDNWELSTARALTVVSYLGSRGIPASMLSAAGFGEQYPRVRGDSALAKAQNRRIEIRITRL